MWRSVVLGSLVLSVSNIASAQSLFSAVDPAPETGSVVVVAAGPEVEPNPVAGFIDFLFGGARRQSQRGSQQWFGAPPRQDSRDEPDGRLAYANAASDDPLPDQQRSDDRRIPRLLRQEVGDNGPEGPGTVVIDTPNHHLYLVQAEGRAIRYGIGVGRPGFTWSGNNSISGKRDVPAWVPTVC